MKGLTLLGLLRPIRSTAARTSPDETLNVVEGKGGGVVGKKNKELTTESPQDRAHHKAGSRENVGIKAEGGDISR